MGAMAIELAEKRAPVAACDAQLLGELNEAVHVLGISTSQAAAALGLSARSFETMQASNVGVPEVADVAVRARMLVAIAHGLEETVLSPSDWLAAPNFLLLPTPVQHLSTAAGLGRILDVIREQRRLQGGPPDR